MKRLAVLGHPVSTRAPRRCRTPPSRPWGWAASGAMRRSTSVPAEFERARGSLPGEGFVGVNVTIPHKEAALALADQASEAAREIGAANTLSFGADGIRAENTDATGPARRAARPGRSARARSSSGRAAPHGPPSGRWPARAPWSQSGTAPRSGRTSWCATGWSGPRDGGRGSSRPVSAEQAEADGHELIVNCTAVGMRDEDPFAELPLDPERLGAGRRPGGSGLRRGGEPACPGGPRARGDGGRRARGPGPSGRRVAAHLDGHGSAA